MRMTYFERDGTHSQMCGNALRCVDALLPGPRLQPGAEAVIPTDDGDKWVWAYDDTVRVALGPGREFRRVAAERYFVFSGLPHLVLLVDDGDDLDALDVATDGAALRYDHGLCLRLGHPEGLHVDYMQRQPDGVRIRTYEVGVEDETLACGTGSAAAAFVAHQAWGTPFPVAVHCRGGVITVDAAEEICSSAERSGTSPAPPAGVMAEAPERAGRRIARGRRSAIWRGNRRTASAFAPNQ